MSSTDRTGPTRDDRTPVTERLEDDRARGEHRDDHRHHGEAVGAVAADRAHQHHDRVEDGDRHDRVHEPAAVVDRHEVVATEREHHGGVKVGSAFFGWLTAMGTAVILTALLAAAGTAVGLSTDTSAADATSQATSDPATVGLVGAIALGVVLFVAYYCGGYVAGRMARFDGARQGVAVWVWAIVIALLVAGLGALAGDQYNVLARLDGFPRLPFGEGELTTAGIVATVVVLVTSLLGAVLGGLAGMRFHRRVDRTGLGD